MFPAKVVTWADARLEKPFNSNFHTKQICWTELTQREKDGGCLPGQNVDILHLSLQLLSVVAQCSSAHGRPDKYKYKLKYFTILQNFLMSILRFFDVCWWAHRVCAFNISILISTSIFFFCCVDGFFSFLKHKTFILSYIVIYKILQ